MADVMNYLITNKPARSQYARRTRTPTGLIVLHTAENIMDSIGPDTGAENVANFIRTRSTPGSYHDLVDSDSIVNLVPYNLQAWQDGTGSNPFALAISFACRSTDWRRMSAAKRKAFLRNGARAYARQQAWLKANGYPTTPLRLISKAESDRGVAGLIYHGHRDPARRSDPGTNGLFPLEEFISECRAALAGGETKEESLMASPEDIKQFWNYDVGGEEGHQPAWAIVSQGRTAARNAEKLARQALADAAGLRVAVNALAEAVGSQQGIDPEVLKRAVEEGILSAGEVLRVTTAAEQRRQES